MMFLNKHGQVVNKTLKSIKEETGKPISWKRMNTIHKHRYTNKEDYVYLKKYLGKVSIFNWNNFQEWGYVYLTPHFQELAINNGAEDLRQ